MKQMTMRSLLLALIVGAYTVQTLPMRGDLRVSPAKLEERRRGDERRAFDIAKENFGKAITPARKIEHLGTLIANVKLRAERALTRNTDEATRQIIFADLQEIDRNVVGYRQKWNIRAALDRFAVTADRVYSFADALALFQPHAVAAVADTAVVAPEAQPETTLVPNAQPTAVEHNLGSIPEPITVEPVNAHPILNQPAAQEHQIVQQQAQGWWSWLVKKSWWLAPIVVAVVALVYGKKSGTSAQRPNGQRPNGQRPDGQR